MSITLNGTTGITTPALDNQGNLTVDGGTIKLDGNYPVGTNNVALGDTALDSLTSGDYNTAIGSNAGTAITTGEENTALGSYAMVFSTTAAYSTAVGYAALGNAVTTGGSNTAVGRYALRQTTSGAANTALGNDALLSNTTASNNTAVGYQSLTANTTGSDNAAVGRYSLGANTTGSYNTAIGRLALSENTTASNNTAVGYQAGYNNTTGGQNTLIGWKTGHSLTTGASNTFVGCPGPGNNCGSLITTGSDNTIIGAYDGNQGGLDIRTASNNIVLSDGDGNPRVVVNSIGKLGVNRTDPAAFISSTNAIGSYCYESVPVNQSGVYYHFDFKVGGTGVGTITSSVSSTSYNTSSDHRLKENVVYDWDATTRLKQLKPARFNFIVDADRTVDGFLAHEAQEVVPEAVRGTHNEVDADGAAVMQGIDQSKLVPLLVKTIQELEARITALEGN
jgi:hypothetical protein